LNVVSCSLISSDVPDRSRRLTPPVTSVRNRRDGDA
jgi:hypothetical protein